MSTSMIKKTCIHNLTAALQKHNSQYQLFSLSKTQKNDWTVQGKLNYFSILRSHITKPKPDTPFVTLWKHKQWCNGIPGQFWGVKSFSKEDLINDCKSVPQRLNKDRLVSLQSAIIAASATMLVKKHYQTHVGINKSKLWRSTKKLTKQLTANKFCLDYLLTLRWKESNQNKNGGEKRKGGSDFGGRVSACTSTEWREIHTGTKATPKPNSSPW